MSYGGFLELDRVRFPTEVAVTARDPSVRVELAWKEPEVGNPLPDRLFRMEPPGGAKVVDLDAAPELPAIPLPIAPPSGP